MKFHLGLLVAAAAVLAIPTGAGARNLNSADPYDSRIIAAYHCNNSATKVQFAESVLKECKSVYDATVRFESSVSSTRITSAQRSTLAIAKGLSMMTMAAGYAELDGKMTKRACQAIKSIDDALKGYDAAASNGLEKLHNMLVTTRDVAIPKCRIGGHWKG